MGTEVPTILKYLENEIMCRALCHPNRKNVKRIINSVLTEPETYMSFNSTPEKNIGWSKRKSC